MRLLLPKLVRLSLQILALASLQVHASELVFGVSRTPLSLPLYVADELGYFKSEGLEVRLQDCVGGHRCLASVIEGKADIATSADTPIMFRSFDSADFYVIATLATTSDDAKLIARSSAGIKDIAGLSGKTVGVVRGASSQYFLDSCLLLNGVDPKSVKTVSMQPEQATELLRTREVDAVAVWEPFGYRASKELGREVAIVPNEGTYSLSWNLVAHRKIIRVRDAELAALLRAVRKANQFIASSPKEAQLILQRRLAVDQGLIDWVWPHLHFGLSLDQMLLKNLESQARWAMQAGHVDSRRPPNYLWVLYEGPLKQADPRAVAIIR